MRRHLYDKWKYDTDGDMNAFWGHLDGGNRELLANWIVENYTGGYKKGGKTQGYDDKQDESLGMRTGKESSKKQSMKARREDSYGKWGKRDKENWRQCPKCGDSKYTIKYRDEKYIDGMLCQPCDIVWNVDWEEYKPLYETTQDTPKDYAKGGDTDKGLTRDQRDRMTDDIYMSEQTMSDSMFQAIDDEVEGDWDVGLYRLSDSQLKKMHTDIKEDRASSYTEHKKGGKTQGYDDKQDESLGMRTGKESSKKQNKKARREDSYGKWGKRGKEDRDISMAHGGKSQGYDDKEDESLGMRTGKESSKKQSMKARREDSYGKWGKRGLRKGRR